MKRRTFLKMGAVAGGGLLIGFHFNGCRPLQGDGTLKKSTLFQPNAWIQIKSNGTIKIFLDRSEMGQGVMTALPMLIAEELDVDLGAIRVESATGHPDYVNPRFKVQITVASSSIHEGWFRLRQAGAVARNMLVNAAASVWQERPELCKTDSGYVISTYDGKRLSYGDLAEVAATMPIPKLIIKENRDFKLIGTSIIRLDAAEKVAGTALFGLDINRPGLLTATVARRPYAGSVPIGFNEEQIKQLDGIRYVGIIKSGIAIVADSFWQAEKGRSSLRIDWDKGRAVRFDDETIRKGLQKASEAKSGHVVESRGSYSKTKKKADRVVRAVYELPYQAHATMEPMNCTAHVRENTCELWVPTQNPEGARLIAAEITGLPLSLIQVHVTFMGCGLGRRQETDFVAEAVELSQRLRVPVKVVWTREDDMGNDFYHPAALVIVEAALENDGQIVGWRYRVTSTSVWNRIAPQYGDLLYLRQLPKSFRNIGKKVIALLLNLQVDPNIPEGAVDLPYYFENILVDYSQFNPGINTGAWRSVGYFNNVFAVESFIDEIAFEIGVDPYELRLQLLKGNSRQRRVIEMVAKDVGWGGPRSPGTSLGIAAYCCLGTFVVMVAELCSDPQKLFRVTRITCAVDCGTVINPDIASGQIESGVAFGLGATLYQSITFHDGRVKELNFDQYPPLRFSDMPEVKVLLADSAEEPTGLGEASVPGVAPAICNGIFALTGKRHRRLPIFKYVRTDKQ
jgi:isoquinoline 1-oxidoreductase subunit beta